MLAIRTSSEPLERRMIGVKEPDVGGLHLAAPETCMGITLVVEYLDSVHYARRVVVDVIYTQPEELRIREVVACSYHCVCDMSRLGRCCLEVAELTELEETQRGDRKLVM
jgi:hypothetical protein